MEDGITRTIYFLVILFIVLFFYGILPIAGALYNRYKWKQFRRHYINFCKAPLLDYRQYRSLENRGSFYRFTGGIESLTDGKILWVKGKDCTIPISLEKTQCWLLPMNEGAALPDPPVQIRWNRISTLTEGVKVFIGGKLNLTDNRLSFESTKENPLIVVFYNCAEENLTEELILGARTRNEYWNAVTPVSLVLGALSLIYISATLLERPAFRITAISAFISIFVPILPVIPPGLLFTAIWHRLTWHARKLRAYRDLTGFNNPKINTRPFSIKAYSLEIAAWLIMIAGIALNLFFIYLILSLLE